MSALYRDFLAYSKFIKEIKKTKERYYEEYCVNWTGVSL